MEITLFPIAKTRLDTEQVAEWLKEVGVQSPDTVLGQLPKTSSAITMLAAKRCYKSFEIGLNPNITQIRESWIAYMDNILKSGHGSVLEHATWTWAIEGCTRVFTAEMNRHRAGVAISEGSMRYIRFDKDIPFWMPFSLRDNSEDSDDLRNKKDATREVFNDVFNYVFESYQKLEKIWEQELDPRSTFKRKKELTSMMRRIVPMGVSTGAVYSFNFRALRHVIALRSTPAAEEEIAFVVSVMAKRMLEEELGFMDFDNTSGFWVPKYSKV